MWYGPLLSVDSNLTWLGGNFQNDLLDDWI